MVLSNFGFVGTFNMGYEGFSKPLALQKMHPIYGNRSELLALLGLFLLVPLIKGARKNNEDALRSLATTNNRYADLGLSLHFRQPSTWTA